MKELKINADTWDILPSALLLRKTKTGPFYSMLLRITKGKSGSKNQVYFLKACVKYIYPG